MEVKCNKCGYLWEYKGDKRRISCSKCKTSIIIPGRPFVGSKPKITSYKLGLKVVDSLAFNRAKAWCKTNGDDYITLKADSEGILSL